MWVFWEKITIMIVIKNTQIYIYKKKNLKNSVVPSGTALGTQILQVTANDRDLSPTLIYDFMPDGNPGRTFSIDRYSGRISVAKQLDYEQQRTYGLKITVRSYWRHCGCQRPSTDRCWAICRHCDVEKKIPLYFVSSILYMDGLAQNCSNAIALAMELLQSCAKPSIYHWIFIQICCLGLYCMLINLYHSSMIQYGWLSAKVK